MLTRTQDPAEVKALYIRGVWLSHSDRPKADQWNIARPTDSNIHSMVLIKACSSALAKIEPDTQLDLIEGARLILSALNMI